MAPRAPLNGNVLQILGPDGNYKWITANASVPVIGIGASARCDGQVLVAEDMLGMFERVPRFVKRYGNMAEMVSDAAAAYAADVRSRAFPTDDQVYRPKI